MLRARTAFALSGFVALVTLATAATVWAHVTQTAATIEEAPVVQRANPIARFERAEAAAQQAATPAPAAAPNGTAPTAEPPAAPKTEPTAAPEPPHVPTVAEARAYAFSQVGAAQFGCLDALWQRESGWNPWARNPSSGAYGIPQALPAGQLARFGGDWTYNPLTQVRWGLWYIAVSYGTPCRAWSFWQNHSPHWY